MPQQVTILLGRYFKLIEAKLLLIQLIVNIFLVMMLYELQLVHLKLIY